MPTSQQPPLPPQVTQQQQGGPLQGMAGAQQATNAQPSMQMVDGWLNEVAQKLEDIAKVLNNETPQLLPILKPVVQGLSMLQGELQKKKKGQAQSDGQAQQPPPQDQGDGGQGGPAPMGAAAMGV